MGYVLTLSDGITVYVSGVNRPVVLKIKGQVHERQKTLEELYTVKMGPVAVRNKSVDMGYISQGRRKSEDGELANMTNQPVKVTVAADEAVSVSISPNPTFRICTTYSPPSLPT